MKNNVIWKVKNNVYVIDFDNYKCEVSGGAWYSVEGEDDLKGLLNQLEGTAKHFDIEVPKEVKNFLYR